MMMSRARLDEIKLRLKALRAFYDSGEGYDDFRMFDYHAERDVSDLIDEVERLRAKVSGGCQPITGHIR